MYRHSGDEKGGGKHTITIGKLRIAVFGEHDVGKSALTVRFLTRRYIGEYKSNTDLLYRQTLAVSSEHSVNIEIVDISTSFVSGAEVTERKSIPLEEIHRADGFIIVYSITEKSTFDTATQALRDILKVHNIYKSPSTDSAPTYSSSSSAQGTGKQRLPVHVALIANKSDLVHLRRVTTLEGIAASEQFGCQFYELSVADNSPQVYSSFHSLITSLIATNVPPPKRKFSVSKMLATWRQGKNPPSNASPVPLAPASITDTNVATTKSDSPVGSVTGGKSGAKNDAKSKLMVFQGTKKRQTSPPFCSL
ncbi:ras-related and estrogen-regulated growth inhibitor-like protein [Folsomia candida]|uniref:small monomeric GTPase n=1 Tax=Folsomia candida TaxID=158441 RepID=A0A226E4F1_FOLCA|nr:ras-related and estrogen-regulated growth inhibitor-like protein [Folsomia candida]OXA51366.1 Ras-related and estrogen-regulated growth inhibitor-like protein [Folsomia candida]